MAEGVAERLQIQQRPNQPLVVPPPLSRPRLLARLRAASAGQATVLRGPAGSGKSRLLADWMHGDAGPCPIPVGPDPQQLWADALAAVERHGGAAVLVLDGVDCWPDDPTTDVVAALLAMPGVRLVLSTRTTPFLPLSRCRLAGELVEIEASELAFTPTEAAAVWWHYGVPLSGPEAAVLIERTEGWPALVCLAALARVDGRLDDDPVHEFLRAEVYAPQPRPARDLLLRMSQVPSVRADLAEVLTGCPDTHRLLDQLRRDGLLVHKPATEGPASDWYRLRRPVQEFLRREAELSIPAELVGIRLRAAQWHADHGDLSTAVGLTKAAGDDRRTAQLVTRFAGPLLLGADHDVLSTLRLPTVEALDDRDVAAALAVAAADRGDAHAAAAYAALVTQDSSQDDRDAHRPVAAALAELVVARRTEPGPAWRATAASVIGLLDAVIPGLVPGDGLIEALAWSTRGMAALADGELEEAARSFATAIERADQAGTRIVDEARAGLALLALVRGQPARAVELFELEGPAKGGESGAPAALRASSTRGLGTAVLEWGRWLLGRAPVTPSTVEGASGSAMVVATRARLQVVNDDAARADQLLRPYGDRVEPLPRLAQEWLALAEADLHLAVGRPVHALTALSQVSHGHDDPLGGAARVMSARAYLASAAPARAASLVAPVQEWPDVGPLIRAEAWLVGALAADAQGHDGTVGIAIAESLAVAAPAGIVAPFRETAVTALLDRHRDLLGRHRAFAAQIAPVSLAGSVGRHPVGDGTRHRVTPPPRNRGVDGHPAPLTEPITAREAVVLRFLPTLLTLNDIARELSVSPNTVKSHLRHIYRKLAVGSRRDAVRQARRFGLLWD